MAPAEDAGSSFQQPETTIQEVESLLEEAITNVMETVCPGECADPRRHEDDL